MALAQAQREACDPLGNPPSEIVAGFLFLGDCDNACSTTQLRHFGIIGLLNVTINEGLGDKFGVSRCFLRAHDAEDQNIADLFTPACSFIDGIKAQGGRVLVHCMAGRSRSASLVIAYMMRTFKLPLHEAYLHVKQASFLLGLQMAMCNSSVSQNKHLGHGLSS
ncbi:unnamed protein product [Polarella glacialis]|uniref:protein-tyrosine-phosphatase n=1 Tax=Polarella glacialis TaxID=89957 RepID=A0A813K562_POLGL|nr:unnamed protein product [Polarella glacialis]